MGIILYNVDVLWPARCNILQDTWPLPLEKVNKKSDLLVQQKEEELWDFCHVQVHSQQILVPVCLLSLSTCYAKGQEAQHHQCLCLGKLSKIKEKEGGRKKKIKIKWMSLTSYINQLWGGCSFKITQPNRISWWKSD